MFLIPTLVGLVYEAILGIPIVGGLIIIGSSYSTLGIALIIHGVILACRIATKDSKIVPFLALVGTWLTWIPGIGWLIHVIIAIAYFIDLFVGRRHQ
ncbi:hypothetical protein [Kurthia massiliensis]|uniref:hypothetical protein n=1 Tax=Kurthia massiliensis TaxID=1033739 RepID=UPI000289CAB2|nr:hypothetical protein [Kurthia massiliensis]